MSGSGIERSFQDTLLFPLQDSNGYTSTCPAQAQDAEGWLSICVEVPRETLNAKESKYTNRAISRQDSVLSETLPGRHFAAI